MTRARILHCLLIAIVVTGFLSIPYQVAEQWIMQVTRLPVYTYK